MTAHLSRPGWCRRRAPGRRDRWSRRRPGQPRLRPSRRRGRCSTRGAGECVRGPSVIDRLGAAALHPRAGWRGCSPCRTVPSRAARRSGS
ncbi:hypothetical protein ACFPRL_05195 [Pseudoclavibacter helvolus]